MGDLEKILEEKANKHIEDVIVAVKHAINEVAEGIDFTPVSGRTKAENLGAMVFGSDKDMRKAIAGRLRETFKAGLVDRLEAEAGKVDATKGSGKGKGAKSSKVPKSEKSKLTGTEDVTEDAPENEGENAADQGPGDKGNK